MPNSVEIDSQAIYEWARGSTELRDALTEAANDIADLGALMAPISPFGSKYSPPGAFKARGFSSELHEDGQGVPYSKAYELSYPGSFLGNAARRTRNANKYGKYGYRVSNRLFLAEAAHEVSSVWGWSA